MEQNEVEALLKRVREMETNGGKLTFREKCKLKKLIKNDLDLFTRTLLKMQNEDPEFIAMANENPTLYRDDNQTNEQIIAANYVALARFTIDKLNMKNVTGLKVEAEDDFFTIFALTPEPIELDLEQFATNKYQYNRELWLEAESLLGELFMENSTQEFVQTIANLIEEAKF